MAHLRTLPFAGTIALLIGFAAQIPVYASYTYITNFTKNEALSYYQPQFPTGQFTTSNSFATPFNVVNDANGNDFAAINLNGTVETISVNIPDVTNVYTLMNATSPGSGDNIATVEFIGSAGADQTFTLVAGNQIRDVYNGPYANTINNTTTQNVSTVTDYGAGGSLYGTWHLDEQNFALSSLFATQNLVTINITNVGNNAAIGRTTSGENPYLFGVTALSAAPEPSETSMLAIFGIALVGLLLQARRKNDLV